MQNYLFILAALIYLVCAFLPSAWRNTLSLAIMGGWLLHGAALYIDMTAPGELRVGFAAMLSATLWISVAAYWLEKRQLSLDSLRVLILPVSAVTALLPVVFPGNMITLDGKSPLFLWHIVISILAYSTLTIAAFHAVLMVLQEARLHARPGVAVQNSWFAVALDRLPALLTMEKLLFRLISFGFFLLTLTVLSGVFFSEELFGRAFEWNHKIIFTLLSWVLFGLLLAGRRWQGWRGRTALGFTLTGFAILFLAY